MKNSKPVIIGVTGGSGSGKTTVSEEIFNRLAGESMVMLPQDAYYNDQSDMDMEARKAVNYDHPDAFDTALLIKQLKQLIGGETIERPTYNYAEYNRSPEQSQLRQLILLSLKVFCYLIILNYETY